MGFPHSNGCEVCRRRKVKCDETRPKCKRCTRAKRLCSGYPKRSLRWEAVEVLAASALHESRGTSVEENKERDRTQTPDLNSSDLSLGKSISLTCRCLYIQDASNGICSYPHSNHRIALPHPQDSLSTSQREPFQTLPIKIDNRVTELVSHYTIDIPRLFYNANASQPIQSLYFPLALLGPIAFQAIVMTSASSSMAKLRGLDETAESLQHKLNAIQAVRVSLSDPILRLNDEVLIAMAAFAELENYYGLKDAASTHMKAAMSVIRQRGGPKAIGKRSPSISIFLNWADCLMVGPRNFADLPSWSTSPNVSRIWHYQSQCLTDLNELLLFLERVKIQPRNLNTGLIQPQRIFSGTIRQRLRQVLALPINFDVSTAHHASIYCRLAALFHIHWALWEYRTQPPIYDRYLRNLDQASHSISETSHLCPGAFTFYLFQTNFETSINNAELSNPSTFPGDLPQVPVHNRLWTIARILRVAKLLSKGSMVKLHHALLSYLCSGEENNSERGLKSEWMQEIKAEIMTCSLPYVSAFTNPSGACPFGDVHYAV